MAPGWQVVGVGVGGRRWRQWARARVLNTRPPVDAVPELDVLLYVHATNFAVVGTGAAQIWAKVLGLCLRRCLTGARVSRVRAYDELCRDTWSGHCMELVGMPQ